MNEGGRVDVCLIAAEIGARARVEAAAAAAGRSLRTVAPGAVGEVTDPPPLILVDLDETGITDELARLAETARVVGFFSHVDTALHDRAVSHGIEAVPRGRFWRDLASIMATA